MNFIFRNLFLALSLVFLSQAVHAQPAVRPSAAPYLNMPTNAPQTQGWRHELAQPLQPKIGDFAGITEHPQLESFVMYSRQGISQLVPKNPLGSSRKVFLDLRNRTARRADSGLLNIIFHPQFGNPASTNRGYVYVWYTHHPDPASFTNVFMTSTNRLSRFTVPDGQDVPDPTSEFVLIEQEDQDQNHAGGGMFFHPQDGFLYIALGDEGKANDFFQTSQKITESLFSGVIRIDVDMRGGNISHPIRKQPLRGRTQHYYVPNDNPWVDFPNALEEFWAIGLRNPWRMSADPATGEVWVGDVGQSRLEEVNLIHKGANYQWSYLEGTLTTPNPKPAQVYGQELGPIHMYGRTNGICIIGGVVYRGARYQGQLGGKYIFGDFTGKVWALTKTGTNSSTVTLLAQIPGTSVIGSIITDREGDIYITGFSEGSLYKLVPNVVQDELFPPLLSETGAFTNAATMSTSPELLPYNVISPLWSDAAAKDRWISVPYHATTNNGAASKLANAAEGEYTYPGGTVFVKHFALQTNHVTDGPLHRLETRLLVTTSDNKAYGVTYKWLPDGSDAELLMEGAFEDISIVEANGTTRTQRWHYPSMQDCMTCHTPESGYVLGFKSHQLNRDLFYPEGGAAKNQLKVLRDLGYLAQPPSDQEIADAPKLVNPITDTTASLHERVKSYLEANCSHCHRPGGVLAEFDARFVTDLIDQNIVDGNVADNLGEPGMQVVTPRDLTHSALFQRITRNDFVRMPPLARNVVDDAAADLIERWIQAMPKATLTQPVANANVPADNVTAAATVQSGELGVAGVDFVLNGAISATAPNAPYQANLTGVAPGNHTLATQVRDNEGMVYGSTPISFSVFQPAVPTVQILAPTNGSTVWSHGLQVTVDADAPEGRTIAEVALRLDGVEVGHRTLAPYVFSVPDMDAGSRTLQAQVWDSAGATATASISLTVQAAPRVQLTSTVPDQSALVLTNRALSLAGVGEDTRWKAYFTTPIAQAVWGVPGPHGQPDALRIPTADVGGGNGFYSGFYQVATPELTNGLYAFAAWLRTTADTYPVFIGLSDSPVKQENVTPTWHQFRWVFPYTWCDCYRDDRVFQVTERIGTNSAWEVARPEVYFLPKVGFTVALESGSPAAQSIELWVNGAKVTGTNAATLTVDYQVPTPGYYTVTGRALTNDGFPVETEPVRVYVGPAPQVQIAHQGGAGILIDAWGANGHLELQQATSPVGPWTTVRESLDSGSFTSFSSLGLGGQTNVFFRAIIAPEE